MRRHSACLGVLLTPLPPALAAQAVPATNWAYNYVEYCKDQDTVRGHEDGTYHPEFVVNRDQMAVYIARALKLTL